MISPMMNALRWKPSYARWWLYDDDPNPDPIPDPDPDPNPDPNPNRICGPGRVASMREHSEA